MQNKRAAHGINRGGVEAVITLCVRASKRLAISPGFRRSR